MAIAYAQGNNAVNDLDTSSPTLAYSSNVTANSLLLLGARLSNTGRTITVSDTQGNTWAEIIVGGKPDGNGSVLYGYWAKAGSTGANTVTFAYSGAVDTVRWNIHEVTGFTTPALDQATSATGNSTTPASGSVTTTHADELLFGIGCWSATRTTTAGSGYTLRLPTPAGASSRMSGETQVVAATGSYNGDFSLDSSAIWAAIIGTFYDSAVGGATGKLVGGGLVQAAGLVGGKLVA